ncbi:nitrous oxide reductase family maturation protein NosD [Dawidia soli]|uniref:Nitrous oxide reductase family maturation protein NosD n=1 Tax=Dawidia soli TaxID=2782352 RepID=A0AAP2D9Y9_9BACT|nr:nitrous oxide reductase family maturation protein NosD [Dawidia soli]MBT1687100.1 nitrous oxide reductase family maturation protein NosD [Dawidia soli]
MRLILLLYLLPVLPLLGRTVTVSKTGPLTSLKQAVAQAQPGDTIRVQAGTYAEGNIVIEKSLVLLGEHYPVLDGRHKDELLTVHARNVIIQGFRFVHTGISSIHDLAGVRILDSEAVRIRGNQFDDTFFGIHISNSSHCRIEDNTLHAQVRVEHQVGNGIHLWKCQHMTLHNNRVHGHRDGIYFEFVTNSLITENYSEGNLRYGLHFMFSHNNEYRRNTFENNGAGVAVMYTYGVKMLDNTFAHNWGSSAYGLLLKDIRDSEVHHNRFIQNSVGIFMEGSSRIRFTQNEFDGNGYAVRLQASCDDNTFQQNNFQANTFDLATNGTLVLNHVDGNYWDKYQGYDLDKDHIGDVPFHPVSMYSMVVEQMPAAVLLWRSFLVLLMDNAEKAIPAITPENLKDNSPAMTPHDLH